MRTRIIASVTLWLAAVASVASIAWVAIDAAGRQITSGPIAASFEAQSPAAGRVGSGGAGESPAAASRSGRSATSQAGGTTRASAPSATTPNPNRHGRDNGDGTGSSKSVAVTYTTPGGRVRARCDGDHITLGGGGYAQPAPGWSVRIKVEDGNQIEADFDLADEQGLVLTAVCVHGTPTFEWNRIEAPAPGLPTSPPAAQ